MELQEGLKESAGFVEALDYLYGEPGSEPKRHPLRYIMLDRVMNRSVRVWEKRFYRDYPVFVSDTLETFDNRAQAGAQDGEYRARSVQDIHELLRSAPLQGF